MAIARDVQKQIVSLEKTIGAQKKHLEKMQAFLAELKTVAVDFKLKRRPQT
jgi:uncharacterized coiled-coil protein SlyX